MKIIFIFLGIILLTLQYKLWVEPHSIAAMWQLKREVKQQTAENKKLMLRNQALSAEVKDLKSGHIAIEERARSELGMIKPGEVFYQILVGKQAS